MAHRLRKTWTFWAIGGALVLIAGAWGIQALLSDSSPETSKTGEMTTQTLDVRPLLIDTSDALSRYVEGLTTGAVTTVSPAHIFYAQNVDWNNEVVVAIQYSLLDAKTVTGASIQTIDDKKAYVIDVLNPPECGSYPQVNSTHVAFIKQSSRDTSLPVILRTTPNTAPCPDVLR